MSDRNKISDLFDGMISSVSGAWVEDLVEEQKKFNTRLREHYRTLYPPEFFEHDLTRIITDWKNVSLDFANAVKDALEYALSSSTKKD